MSEIRRLLCFSWAVGALILCSFFFSITAFAEDGADNAAHVYECDNGWKLEYTVDDGKVTITNVTEKGSDGSVVIPEEINSAPVVKIGNRAFQYIDEAESAKPFTNDMTSIVIPDSVTSIDTAAFMNCGLREVTVPASVIAIPSRCFTACSHLEKVEFEGSSIQNLGEMAFSGCSSLLEITIPELTKNLSKGYRIGNKCFNNCSSLQTVVFDGDNNTESGKYFSSQVGSYACFVDCENLKDVVFMCKKCNVPSSGSGDSSYADSNKYYTVTFYDSEQDSKDCKNPVYSITCLSGTELRDIVNGTVKSESIWPDTGVGEIPDLKDGEAWGLTDYAFTKETSTLTDSHNAIRIDRRNLNYGWVSSPALDAFQDSSTMSNTVYPLMYLMENGVVEGLGDIKAYGADGKILNESDYNLIFEKAVVTQNVNGSRSVRWDEASNVDTISETGVYRVHAEGAIDENEGTKTFVGDSDGKVGIFEVVPFTTSVSQFNRTGAARWASAAQVVATAVRKKAEEAASKESEEAASAETEDAATEATSSAEVKSAVVVPASDWRYQLIGAGLAGVANGLLLFDNRDDYSSDTVTAFIESGATNVQVVGSTDIVPQSDAGSSSDTYLVDYLYKRVDNQSGSKTRYSNYTSIQELSDLVYTTIKRMKERGRDEFGDGWGTTAIVASAYRSADALSIARYAYSQHAPVFFVQDDGMLSDTDLGYLRDGGFASIVLAGDSSYVSDACASAVQSACSIAPTRLLDGGVNSLEAALASWEAFGSGIDSVAIASTEDDANVVAAAQIAAATGGTVLPCSCAADAKRIEEFLSKQVEENGQSCISNVYLVGDFSSTSSDMYNRVFDAWASQMSTDVSVGDTIESGDFIYEVMSDTTARFSRVRDAGSNSATIDNATYGGVTYTFSSIPSSLFANSPNLTSITILAGASSVNASMLSSASKLATLNLGSCVTTIANAAFQGHATLANISAPSVASVGENAFQGCPALASASLPSATSVAAGAFKGCAALASASIPAAGSVGEGAFQDCSALASVTLGPALNSLGASAFQGCAALPEVQLGSAPVSIGLSAFQGCAALATVAGDSIASVGDSAFADCTALSSFDSATAASIGSLAFSGCSSLASVSAAKVTSVGENAFQGCPALASASLPSATSVAAGAFKGCAALASASIPAAGSVGEGAFQDCSALASVTLGPALSSLGASAFQGCAALPEVQLGSAPVSIGLSAFQGCAALTTVAGSAIASVGDVAFSGCAKLASVKFGASPVTIGKSAFSGCAALKSVSGTKVKSVSDFAFQSCSALTTFSSNSMTSIGSKAFYGCKALKKINASKLKTLGAAAFQNCTKLGTVKISSTGLSKVGSKAFFNCKKLKNLTLKTSKLKSGRIGAKAFKGMPAKAKVSVPKKKVKTYKTLFVKKGLSAKATVKAA